MTPPLKGPMTPETRIMPPMTALARRRSRFGTCAAMKAIRATIVNDTPIPMQNCATVTTHSQETIALIPLRAAPSPISPMPPSMPIRSPIRAMIKPENALEQVPPRPTMLTIAPVAASFAPIHSLR
eukprot:4405027-Prymnesium_polylepis.1